MSVDPWQVAVKTISRSRYIALLKECGFYVGAAAINMAPLAGWKHGTPSGGGNMARLAGWRVSLMNDGAERLN